MAFSRPSDFFRYFMLLFMILAHLSLFCDNRPGGKRSMIDNEYLPLIQAAAYLGVSRPTIKRLISEGELTTTPSPLDRRVKLVKRADLDRLRSAPRSTLQSAAPQSE